MPIEKTRLEQPRNSSQCEPRDYDVANSNTSANLDDTLSLRELPHKFIISNSKNLLVPFSAKAADKKKENEVPHSFRRLRVRLRLLTSQHGDSAYPQNKIRYNPPGGDGWGHLLHQRRSPRIDESHLGIFGRHHRWWVGDSLFCVFHATTRRRRIWFDHCQG